MLDNFVEHFQDLIRRYIAPTVAFFVVVLVVDFAEARLSRHETPQQIANDYGSIFERVVKAGNPGVMLTLAIVFTLGMSYALMTLQQVLFDNWLKKNFEPLGMQIIRWLARWWAVGKCARAFRRHRKALEEALTKLRSGGPDANSAAAALLKEQGEVSHCPCALWLQDNSRESPTLAFRKSEVLALQQLRRCVVERLEQAGLGRLHKANDAPLTDYVLYEILGGIDRTPTRPFVDSAKAIGIFFASVILVLVGEVLLNPHFHSPGIVLSCVALALFSFWAGFNVICGQYRARALRLYVNFLAMPQARVDYLLFPEEWAAGRADKEGS